MKQYRVLAILIASLLASGCVNDYIRDRGNDYLDAELYPATEVPEGMDGSQLGSTLAIPDRKNRPESEEFEVPRPNAIVLSSDNENYRIEQEGAERWILARRTPSQLWPDLVRFWAERGVTLQSEDPANGEMETHWVIINEEDNTDKVVRYIRSTFGDDAEQTQDKFRVSIQQGVVAGSSEVYLFHARSDSDEELPAREEGESSSEDSSVESVVESTAEDSQISAEVQWISTSDTDLLQSAMLNEMLVFISKPAEQTQSVSLVARELEIGARASLVQDGNGYPVLNLNLDYGRSWAAVGRALGKTSVQVVDRDRDNGLYYLELEPGESLSSESEDEDKDSGFFGGLFSEEEVSEDAETTDINYQLRLTRLGRQVKVTVEKSSTELAPEDISTELLTLIKDNLG